MRRKRGLQVGEDDSVREGVHPLRQGRSRVPLSEPPRLERFSFLRRRSGVILRCKAPDDWGPGSGNTTETTGIHVNTLCQPEDRVVKYHYQCDNDAGVSIRVQGGGIRCYLEYRCFLPTTPSPVGTDSQGEGLMRVSARYLMSLTLWFIPESLPAPPPPLLSSQSVCCSVP